MIDGRYESLGLAIYRALQASPSNPAFGGLPIHAWLINGLKGIKPFLKQDIESMEKDIANWGPEIAKGREMNIDQLKEELHWVKDAVNRIEQMEKDKAYSNFHEVEIKGFENQR